MNWYAQSIFISLEEKINKGGSAGFTSFKLTFFFQVMADPCRPLLVQKSSYITNEQDRFASSSLLIEAEMIDLGLLIAQMSGLGIYFSCKFF